MVKECINCKHVYRRTSDSPCSNCCRSYSDRWEKCTDEQIKIKKDVIHNFRNRLENRLPDALKGTDILSVDSLITDIQNEMLKELGICE